MLCSRFWPDRHGGVETRLWHVSKALARSGIPVDVVTENRVNAPPLEIIEANLIVRRIDQMDAGRMWRWPAWPRTVWWRDAIRRLAHRPIIWATDPVIAFAAISAGYGNRVVYNPAGCIAAMRRTAQIYKHMTTLMCPRHLAWVDRYSYHHSAKVVVSSHNIRRQMEHYYSLNNSTHIVPHGVKAPSECANREIARARWGIGPNEYVIGAVGRLDPCKGLDDLLRAVSISEHKEITRVLLVGDGPDRKRLREITRQLNLDFNVVWAGDTPDPSPAYAAIDVLAVPSIYEAFGNVLLEAMAHGVPVVGRGGNDCNTLTACDEIIDHGITGFVVDPLSTSDLANKLAWLWDHPAERKQIGNNAARQARERPWERVANEYLQLLKLDLQASSDADLGLCAA